MAVKARRDNTIVDQKYGLNQKQLDFCVAYVELGNAKQAALKAGYSEKTAQVQGSTLLTNQKVKDKIYDLRHDDTKRNVATALEVMEFFTRVMNGEVKDQFNLEASLSDRLKAANELAKRTVDVDQKASDKADNQIHIKLEWGKDDDPKADEQEDE